METPDFHILQTSTIVASLDGVNCANNMMELISPVYSAYPMPANCGNNPFQTWTGKRFTIGTFVAGEALRFRYSTDAPDSAVVSIKGGGGTCYATATGGDCLESYFGAFFFAGAFPDPSGHSWLVYLNDGGGRWEIDGRLEIWAIDPGFPSAGVCSGDGEDPFLADWNVLWGMKQLWNQTGYGGEPALRRERAGWIVPEVDAYSGMPTGLYKVIPIQGYTSTTCTSSFPLSSKPANAVGQVHTHPFAEGEGVPAGVCPERFEGGTATNVSEPDYRSSARLGIPVYAIHSTGLRKVTATDQNDISTWASDERQGCINTGG